MPLISIIIPCYNEQPTIGEALDAIQAQTFPLSDIEVVIADGMSQDGTRQVIDAFASQHPNLQIKVLDNVKRTIPSGLNLALKNSSGKFIIRLDGHSIPSSDYVTNCFNDLEAGLGDIVGGIWNIHPGKDSWLARSIAVAASHPLGAGDALYRTAGGAGEVDTVPFGAFRRELLARVGIFDESLLSNEDYEFFARLRRLGGKVWLDPSIQCTYFSRPDLSALAKQYFRYGFWKWRMLRRYPGTVRWRQALPPLFLISLVGLGVLGFLEPLFHLLLLVEMGLYSLALGLAGMQVAFKQKSASHLVGIPLAIGCMHFSWGTGFLWSMIIGLLSPRGAGK
jgi:succinoglycan biosynthesis protein ExoA